MAIHSPDQCDDTVPIGTRTRAVDDDVSDSDCSSDGSAGATERDATPIVPHTRVPR